MNWKTLLVVLIASAASAFGGAWLALNRDALPESLGGTEPIPTDAAPWVTEIVQRVDQLERQNTELKETLTTAQERMTEIETVFVASGLEWETAAEQLAVFRETLVDTDDRLSRVHTDLAAAQDELEDIRTEKEREEQELKLEDFIFIEPSPINGVPGPHIIFEGVNVHVLNGGGGTPELNGVGNLFVGYNEPGTGPRFGSHNLVVGPGHSYASYGALIAGESNTVTAPSGTVSGGSGNLAAGVYSVVCGGESNTTTGEFASVVGGAANTASGAYANISGGQQNRASGELTVVFGGATNHAQARLTAVLGSVSKQTSTGNKVWLGGFLDAPQQ